jgi:BMFP domain-containing protein YqiC
MNEPETLLENRLLALEARVVALETATARRPEKSQRAESLAKDMSDSHFNFRIDLLSLIEDHVEVLKLIHNMVGPADRLKNKQVLTYIRRAESKLAMFQAKFAQVEARHQLGENAAPQNAAPQPGRTRTWSYLNPLTLYRFLRPAAWDA